MVHLVVTPELTAAAYAREADERSPGGLATRAMTAGMERAAARLLQPLLGAGELSVVQLAPAPVGTAVTTPARFARRDGQLFWLDVWAEDGAGVIGRDRGAGRGARRALTRCAKPPAQGERRSISQGPAGWRV